MFFIVLVVVWIGGYLLLDSMAQWSTSYKQENIINWIEIAWFFTPIILLSIYWKFFDKRNKKIKG
jgi:hypothetical protein